MSIILFLALLTTACSYALWRGGAPERIAAALQISAFLMSFAVHRLVDARGYETAEAGTLAVDVLLLFGLVVLAWRSTRFWPLWVAGWQLAAIIAHLAKLLDQSMLPVGYAIQAQIWAYPMLVATAIGAARHMRRVRAGDPDVAWKPLVS